MAGELRKNELTNLRLRDCSISGASELNLASCDLSVIPNEAYYFIHLRTLNLHNNHLVYLDPSIGKLQKLEILNLSRNKLFNLPSSIEELKGLKKLNLSDNVLVTIQPEICSLLNLKELYLQNNEINELPEDIVQLKSLKTLNLNSNKIEFIPLNVELDEFPNLEIINLNNNLIDKHDVPWKLRCLNERFSIVHDNNHRKDLVKRNLATRRRVAARLLDLQFSEEKYSSGEY